MLLLIFAGDASQRAAGESKVREFLAPKEETWEEEEEDAAAADASWDNNDSWDQRPETKSWDTSGDKNKDKPATTWDKWTATTEKKSWDNADQWADRSEEHNWDRSADTQGKKPQEWNGRTEEDKATNAWKTSSDQDAWAATQPEKTTNWEQPSSTDWSQSSSKW